MVRRIREDNCTVPYAYCTVPYCCCCCCFFSWYLSIYPSSLSWSSSLLSSSSLLLLFSCVFIHLPLFGFLLMLKCFSFGCLFVWFSFLFFFYDISVGPKHGILFQKTSCSSSDEILCTCSSPVLPKPVKVGVFLFFFMFVRHEWTLKKLTRKQSNFE